MGRKAKLKKLRREIKANPPTETSAKSTHFVDRLGKLGYQLDQIERSPEVPNQKIEPQL